MSDDIPCPTPEEVTAAMEALWAKHDSEIAQIAIIDWVCAIFEPSDIMRALIRENPRMTAAMWRRLFLATEKPNAKKK